MDGIVDTSAAPPSSQEVTHALDTFTFLGPILPNELRIVGPKVPDKTHDQFIANLCDATVKCIIDCRFLTVDEQQQLGIHLANKALGRQT